MDSLRLDRQMRTIDDLTALTTALRGLHPSNAYRGLEEDMQLNMGHGALKGTMGGLLIGLLSRQYVNTALLRRGKRRYLYCTIAEQTP
ncbi:hypothetical protein MKY48_16410 [Paenibacillus sp. FSL W8-0187]|uniref:hypothetical protein n=1 Tax=unclassified Paenibacillus TaxID=185978 RepID=UPI0030DAF966